MGRDDPTPGHAAGRAPPPATRSTLAAALAPLAVRVFQTLLDPFEILLPGASSLLQRCGLCGNSARYTGGDRLARGLVAVLPGIEGPGLYAMTLRRGLRHLPAAVPVLNWAGWWPAIINVFSRACRQRRLDLLVRAIRGYRGEYPGRPVVLVGHSLGAAMAIFAAEALGPAEPLTGVVATAVPLHADYDLSAALAGVSGGLVCAHSRLDVQLRALTALGGNVDGRFGPTAGQAGFRREHPKLHAIAWDWPMIGVGHWGGHTGWAGSAWVAAHVAPIIADWLG